MTESEKQYKVIHVTPAAHLTAKIAAAKAGVSLLEFTERALAAEARRVEWQPDQPKGAWHRNEDRMARMME